MARSTIADALKLLSHLGFNPVYNKGGVRRFDGKLKCGNDSVDIQLSISDWDFIEYPVIRLLGEVNQATHIRSHLYSDHSLCYFRKGAVILDRTDPVSAIQQCLNQATKVLSLNSVDSADNAQDVVAEFQNYWALTEFKFGLIKANADQKKFSVYRYNGKEKTTRQRNKLEYIICEDLETATRIFSIWDSSPVIDIVGKCYILKCDKPPPTHSSKLPTTVHQLLQWLKDWHVSIYQRFQQLIELEAYAILPFPNILCKVEYPGGELSFFIPLPKIISKLTGDNRNKAYVGKALRQHLNTRGGQIGIDRILFEDISPEFLHGRNIEHPSLAGKKVLIIGCGAIGGYLSSQLAAIGAGTSGGELFLCDSEKLHSENMGRHILGIKYIFENKAYALSAYLKEQFPCSNVTPLSENVNRNTKLSGYDIVIDATGEESFSQALNSWRVALGKKAPPVLHTWVKGNGECVQALWCTHGEACYQCLRLGGVDDFHKERFETLKNETRVAYKACNTYTPYSVTAAISAATLATELTIDWLSGNPSPRWRTKFRENADCRIIKNQDISPINGCHVCGNNG